MNIRYFDLFLVVFVGDVTIVVVGVDDVILSIVVVPNTKAFGRPYVG